MQEGISYCWLQLITYLTWAIIPVSENNPNRIQHKYCLYNITYFSSTGGGGGGVGSLGGGGTSTGFSISSFFFLLKGFFSNVFLVMGFLILGGEGGFTGSFENETSGDGGGCVGDSEALLWSSSVFLYVVSLGMVSVCICKKTAVG